MCRRECTELQLTALGMLYHLFVYSCKATSFFNTCDFFYQAFDWTDRCQIVKSGWSLPLKTTKHLLSRFSHPESTEDSKGNAIRKRLKCTGVNRIIRGSVAYQKNCKYANITLHNLFVVNKCNLITNVVRKMVIRWGFF